MNALGWVYFGVGLYSNYEFLQWMRRRDRIENLRLDPWWAELLMMLNFMTLLMWPLLLPECLSDRWHRCRYKGRHTWRGVTVDLGDLRMHGPNGTQDA